MPLYKCRIADAAGRIVVEMREASGAEEAARALAGEGRTLVSLVPIEAKRRLRPAFSDRVVLEFTKTLAVLLQAGLPLEAALEVASSSFEGQKPQALSELLRLRIMKGESFSSSLEGSGARLSPVYKGLVCIGERTGQLEPLFLRIASYLEEQKRLVDKLRGALVYPGFVLGILGLMLVGIALFLVPGLKSVFADLGTGVPPRTAAALSALGLLAWVLIALIAAGVGALFGLRALRSSGHPLAVTFDRLVFSIPLLGRYLVLSESLAFAFAMETLVSSGIGLEDALAEGVLVLRNQALVAELGKARSAIVAGEPLSRAFAACPSLPREFSRWATVGERTGSVETIFGQSRGYFQHELETWTTRFMSLVEPALIVAVGGILVSILVTFIIPFLTSFTALP